MTTPRQTPNPANGLHTTQGTPHGYASLTPFIVVDGAARAIDFYVAVFGVHVLSRFDGPFREDGTPSIVHAELQFPQGVLQLSDPNPTFGMIAPPPASDGFSQSIVVYVPDVDATVARAQEQGAHLVEEVSTFVSGDRTGAVLDPFGRRWAIMTRVEDLSPQESSARVQRWLDSLGSDAPES